jgi:hypothetical protein
MVHICNPSYLEEGGRRTMVKASLGKSMRSYLKNMPKTKRTVGVAQVVESLLASLRP